MRTILGNKLYHLINLIGLSLSITGCLLIFLYVEDELSFDRFHQDANEIYRISLTLQFGDLNIFVPTVSAPLGQAVSEQVPEVRSSLRLYGLDLHHVLRYQEKSYSEKKILYADSNFFSFFSFHLLEGDAKTALQEPHSIVITPALSSRYFGTNSVLGKLLTVDGETFTVTGLAAAPPGNSHIQFDALLSMASTPLGKSHSWMGNRFLTYLKLNPDAPAEVVDEKMDDLVLKNIGPDLENSLGISLQQFLQQKNKIGYDLHRMVDTHLKSQFPRDMTPASDILYVYLFAATGVALLLIACFNSMNLSTARFVGQVRAVSIKKMLGASRGRLIYSFFSESLAISFISAIVSIVLAYVLLPYVNFISGKAFDLSSLMNESSILALLSIALMAGLLSASYPAVHLTSFNPAQSLRGKSGNAGHSERVRNVLVILQYGISITLAVFTLVLFGQLEYINRQNIGFQKEGILSIRNIDRLGTKAHSLKTAMLAENVVVAASFTDRTIFERMSGEAVRIPGEAESHLLNFYTSDEDQLSVMGYRLIMGRFFSKEFPSDSTVVVINQAAMKELGWTSIEGKELAADGDLRYKVVGVINDFNYETLRSEIKPLFILFQKTPASVLNIRYRGSAADLRDAVTRNWALYGNSEPLEYTFLEEDFDRLFLSEVRIGKLLTLACMAILIIASLGLFALSSFVADKRIREIGIRKALGATTSDIRQLLLTHFLKLILIAFLFSVPLAYFTSQRWLEGFAFRQELTAYPFAVAGLGAVVISLLTLSYFAIRASRTDPAAALRLD